MELNTAMRFVMMRAEAEAAATFCSDVRVEHVFLGILKLSELTAEDFAPASRHKVQLDADISMVKALLIVRAIDSGRLRTLLRSYLEKNALPPAGQDFRMMQENAEILAKGDSLEEISASIVLEVILDFPTVILREFLTPAWEQAPENTASLPAEEAAAEERTEMGIGFLPELTGRIRKMRATLLGTVHGQDHVVHAFSEGMFSAELLAASDEKRKRPRAIFVFAGPPGVGKTFLAEQAAEALALPFQRFDMSSFSDHQAHINLIGFEPSYKDSKPGTLTGFVKENQHCILLFDEIEKAHENTIHQFLQILDAGRLKDNFLEEEISFKDTIIIFTSNAGRALYEGDAKQNAAGIPRKTIINALETEINPTTNKPFFPSAICSRIATGWSLLFNHLQANDLEKISAGELRRLCGLFEKQYGISVDFDELLSTTLLFAEGGQVDARTLRAQTEIFFKNEIFKLCRLWSEEAFSSVLEGLKKISFKVEDKNLPADVSSLFGTEEKNEILLFADPIFAERCREELPKYIIYDTQEPEEAFRIAGERNLRLVLVDLTVPKTSLLTSIDPEATVFEDESSSGQFEGTIAAFDNIPIASASLHVATRFFRDLRERLPELPIYLLETSASQIDAELEMSFVRAGARGKLRAPSKEFSVFEDELKEICRHLYMQQMAGRMAAEHKVLFFETAPKVSPDRAEVTIRLRDLALKRALLADDSGDVLADVEKPKVRFDDVIGAGEAKEELQFFVDYLKNPKKFTAQGLKPPKGVLLYGPPGTGKTLLAKAMAGESDVAFIATAASTFVTKYQGSGPEAVRTLFKRARRYAPAIIFIDEIDAVGRARGGMDTGHGEEMALNALLTEMDGFSVDTKRPVFVLAATNFDVEEGKGGVGTIDAALARRFDRKILVDLPNKDDRRRYLVMMLKANKTHTVSEEMIERLAGRSTGMSLANMASVIELANRTAVKKQVPLNDEILEEAYELTRHGAKKDWGHDYLERVARHESGHAFMCYTAGSTPAYLTIVARGDHGGYMEHQDTENSPLQTKEALTERIRTALGGRAAEIVYYGEKDGISTGASGDLESATNIARAMICNYGMDEELGMAVLSKQEATRGPLAGKVSERVSRKLKDEMAATVNVITEARPRIDKLVNALLEKNKLTKQEIEAILSE